MTEFLYRALSELSPEKGEVLARLCEATYETAQVMNITARKSLPEIVFYHVADSLSLLGDVKGARRVCDVGTGGGFPGLVLAVLCPETEFVLMDATQKKVAAIERTARSLGLNNVTPLAARAEEAGRGEARERFDVVVSRALAALPMLLEFCLPLTRVGGRFLAMKGPRYEEEIRAAKPILARLGKSELEIRRESLSPERFLAGGIAPNEQEAEALGAFCAMERTTLLFEKKSRTPKEYPRPFQQIAREKH